MCVSEILIELVYDGAKAEIILKISLQFWYKLEVKTANLKALVTIGKLILRNGGAGGKESDCQCRRYKRHEFNSWVGKIPWSRKWQPAPVFLAGKSHGQKRLQSMWLQRVGHDWVSTHILQDRCVLKMGNCCRWLHAQNLRGWWGTFYCCCWIKCCIHLYYQWNI